MYTYTQIMQLALCAISVNGSVKLFPYPPAPQDSLVGFLSLVQTNTCYIPACPAPFFHSNIDKNIFLSSFPMIFQLFTLVSKAVMGKFSFLIHLVAIYIASQQIEL